LINLSPIISIPTPYACISLRDLLHLHLMQPGD
jgi:hypothetical protein